jgi:lipopolysaccharide/colanic/teichoic acid biosynthesis glycosyltransferase
MEKNKAGEEVLNLRRSLENTETGLFATGPDLAANRGALNEEAFHRMISLERKRAERSHKPFLLMLLDIGEAASTNNRDSSLSKILAVLSLTTRETDVVGWYKNATTVGAMFTEFETEEKKLILSTMLTRVSSALQDSLNPEQFHQLSISFYWFPEQWQDFVNRRPNVSVFYPDLAKRNRALKFFRIVKRTMDILGSIVALIVGSPVFGCIAVAIKLTSQGPVLYRQQRVGQLGAPFSLLKFRSMYCGNNNSAHKEYVWQMISGVAERRLSKGNGQGVYKLTADPRITRVGAFLRKTSLDELPQFINVLKGEMSLVGPRPPIDYELEKYDLWHRRRVMEAKPGITGIWQVSGRNKVPFDQMVRLDLMYARTWSPWLDLKILLRTPRAVVAGAH